MKILLSGLSYLLLAQSLYALSDYRCSDKSLCEICEYKDVSSINEAFTEGRVDGQIRLAYINQDNHETSVPGTYATSIGGQLKYETAKLYHVSLAVSAFVSQRISGLSGDKDKGELNPDFFGEDYASFVYMGEAYVDYEYEKMNFRVGRQKLDTPLNDRDDIRMLPNTFEAAMAGYGGIVDTVLVAGYVTRWAGYDSGEDISKFKDLPGEVETTGENGKGMFLFGVMNESLDNIELQAWYYDFDKLAGVLYMDAIYGAEYESGLDVEFGVQFGNYAQKSSSKTEGDVYGGILGIGYEGLVLGVAGNYVDTGHDENIILGYGGGPYFTSMEEMTINAINDAKAYVLFSELDFSKILMDGLSLSYAYGHFKGYDLGVNIKYDEHDVILSYEASEEVNIEASYASVNDQTRSGAFDTGYDRFLVRANYNF